MWTALQRNRNSSQVETSLSMMYGSLTSFWMSGNRLTQWPRCRVLSTIRSLESHLSLEWLTQQMFLETILFVLEDSIAWTTNTHQPISIFYRYKDAQIIFSKCHTRLRWRSKSLSAKNRSLQLKSQKRKRKRKATTSTIPQLRYSLMTRIWNKWRIFLSSTRATRFQSPTRQLILRITPTLAALGDPSPWRLPLR